MEIPSQFVTTTRSTSRGSFEVRVPSLDAGYHQIVVTEENGGQDTAPLFIEKGERIFVVQDRPTWALRIEQYIPWYLAYALVGLLILFIIGTLLALVLSRYRKRFIAMWSIGLILVVAMFGAWYLNRMAGGEVLLPLSQTPIVRQPIDARGTVVAPFGKSPVEGVDLVLGDTAIRTSAGGQFVFQNARLGDTIRLTHPLLRRAVDWRLERVAAPFEIPFDAGLYNAANAVLDAEARGQGTGSSLYDAGNLADQSLVVSGVRFEKSVAFVELVNGDRGQEYAFSFVDGTWVPAK